MSRVDFLALVDPVAVDIDRLAQVMDVGLETLAADATPHFPPLGLEVQLALHATVETTEWTVELYVYLLRRLLLLDLSALLSGHY